MYRDTPQMYACDAHCLSLVKRGLRAGASGSLRPIERVFLCLASLTHSEALNDQLLCMEEWDRAMTDLEVDDPLNAAFLRDFPPARCGDQALRPVSPPQYAAAARQHGRGGRIPWECTFRFDLPLIRRPNGVVRFRRNCQKAHGKAARPRVRDVASAGR